jgi:hypothetical protein
LFGNTDPKFILRRGEKLIEWLGVLCSANFLSMHVARGFFEISEMVIGFSSSLFVFEGEGAVAVAGFTPEHVNPIAFAS